MLPTVTVNCWRQALHMSKPGRADSPAMRVAFLLWQCGQTGPSGQSRLSKYSRAVSWFNFVISASVRLGFSSS